MRCIVAAGLIGFALTARAAEPAADALPSDRSIQAPAAELALDPFYEKCVMVAGFPVVSSGQVSDCALREAAYLIENMLAARPDVLAELARGETRFAVMAPAEFTTDIPEHSDLQPSRYWDKRARGLGATSERPVVSCGEENLLCLPGDPYPTENILIHEFAHAIHEMGLNRVDPKFDERLRDCYKRAMERGLWKDTYAATNHHEYWAEGAQSWFDTNRPPDAIHNDIDTREELKTYDPDLAALLREAFGDGEWRYVRPDKREAGACQHQCDKHAGVRFEWPAALVQWNELYEKRQKTEKQSEKK